MFEVDLTRIVNLRNKLKNGFEQRYGARLTFMPFFVRAAIIALQQYPIVNASMEGEGIRYHKHVNAGIAVALDWGLIVPVLKNADELNFLGLQRGITDLGERARSLVGPLTSGDREGAWRALSIKETHAHRCRGFHVHNYEPGTVRCRIRSANHQSAELRHHGCWRNLEDAYGRNR